MNRDLLPGYLMEPLSMNAYAYVGNSPVNYVDPLGLSKVKHYWIAGQDENGNFYPFGYGLANKISGPNINHVNGAIGEARTYDEALAKGEIGIQQPGKVTEVGPDYITFDPSTGYLNVYDAKFRSNGDFPSTAKGFESLSWYQDIQEAINNISDPVLKQKVQDAFNKGDINWKIAPWLPQGGGNETGGGTSEGGAPSEGTLPEEVSPIPDDVFFDL